LASLYTVHERKILSVVPGHVLLLFYKVCTITHAFLPVLHKLKDPSVVEHHSGSSQPTTHEF
jgi:hypothetical protein